MGSIDVQGLSAIAPQLVLALVGFIFASFVWHFIGSIFQAKAYEHRDRAAMMQVEREAALKVFGDLTTLLESRAYRMRLLCWSLSADKVDRQVVEKHLEEYRKILSDWNSSRARYLATVYTYFGGSRLRDVDQMFREYKRWGSEIEACYRAWKAGKKPKDIEAIEYQLQLLTVRVENLGFALTQQIREGNVGLFNTDRFPTEGKPLSRLQRLASPLIHLSKLIASIPQSRTWRIIRGYDEPYETGNLDIAPDDMQVIIHVGSAGDQYQRDPKYTSLADTIAEVDPSLYVQIPVPEPIDRARYGVTWAELITIVVPAATGYLGPKIADAAIKWATVRIKDEIKNRTGAKGRPKHIRVIVGPNGRVLKSVMVKGVDEEPEDLMGQESAAGGSPGLIIPKTYPRKRTRSERLLALFNRHK